MNSIVSLCIGFLWWGWLQGWPMMHNMSSLNMALQWYLWASHVHTSSHVGTMFS